MNVLPAHTTIARLNIFSHVADPVGRGQRAESGVSMNRRKGRRRRIRTTVGLEPGGITSYTGDLSWHGVFIHSNRVHRPGTRVRVVLRTPSGPVSVAGIVRWAKRVPPQFLQHVKGGMGIEFTEFPPELTAYLAEAIPDGQAAPEQAPTPA